MTNPKKILFILVVLAVATGAFWYVRGERCAELDNEAPVNIVTGEVVRLSDDKIYFETTIIKPCEEKVEVRKREMAAVVSMTTEFYSREPLTDKWTPLTKEDISIGRRISVYYDEKLGDTDYRATKIELLADDDRYRVDNLIKSLEK